MEWNYFGMGLSLGFMIDSLLHKNWMWAVIYGSFFVCNLCVVLVGG